MTDEVTGGGQSGSPPRRKSTRSTRVAERVSSYIIRHTGIPFPKAKRNQRGIPLPFPYVAIATATTTQQGMYHHKKAVFDGRANGTLPFIVRFTHHEEHVGDAIVMMRLEDFCVLLETHYKKITEGTEDGSPSDKR